MSSLIPYPSSLIPSELFIPALVDSHCHIDGSEFDADRAAVLKRARIAGVETLVVIGTGDPQTDAHERAVTLAEQHDYISDDAPQIFATVGVHPHDARLYDYAAEAKLKTLASSKRVIAWGEVGLDYHYDNSPREVQREVFAKQLSIAKELSLPVIIHTREADADTYDVIKTVYGATARGGVMHCFSGDLEFAKRMIDLNFMISIAGVITFRKSESLREVARGVPIERLLVETDAPYLAPVPYRGKRNEPAYTLEIVRAIADARNKTFEEIAHRTSANFAGFFRVDVPEVLSV